MKALQFEDFFGTIDFSDSSFYGDGPPEMRKNAITAKRNIDAAADLLNRSDARPGSIATHNHAAQKWAAEIATDYDLSVCPTCKRYCFVIMPRCLHQDCPTNKVTL